MTLTIDLTTRCNLECEFCYQEKLDFSEHGDLSCEEILQFVDKYDQFDTVELGGGEPMFYDNLIPLIQGIYEKGKKMHISTNGTFFPSKFMDLDALVKKDIQMQFSLHATSHKLYSEITGYDVLDIVCENIGRVSEEFPTLISSSIYKKNLDEVPNLIKFAEGANVPLRVNLVFPSGKGKDVELLSRKEVDELSNILLMERIRKGPMRYMIDSPLIHENNCVLLHDHYGIVKEGDCPADVCKVYIAPDGSEHPCEFWEE